MHWTKYTAMLCCTYVINWNSLEAKLFKSGGEESTSAEDTAQDEPTAMPICGLVNLPLLNITTADSTKHAAYADNISCVGK